MRVASTSGCDLDWSFPTQLLVFPTHILSLYFQNSQKQYELTDDYSNQQPYVLK